MFNVKEGEQQLLYGTGTVSSFFLLIPSLGFSILNHPFFIDFIATVSFFEFLLNPSPFSVSRSLIGSVQRKLLKYLPYLKLSEYIVLCRVPYSLSLRCNSEWYKLEPTLTSVNSIRSLQPYYASSILILYSKF